MAVSRLPDTTPGKDGKTTQGEDLPLLPETEVVGRPPGTPQFFLPSYTRWDAGHYCRRGWLDAALYLENLFDEQCYTSSIRQFQIMPGAPFIVRARAAYRF